MYKPTPDFGWSLGDCSGSGIWLGSGTYTDICCISEEQHILNCWTSSHYQRDWSNTILMMLGHQFCDDFVGHNAFIPLNISGISLLVVCTPVYITPRSCTHHKVYLFGQFLPLALRFPSSSTGDVLEIDETVYKGI